MLREKWDTLQKNNQIFFCYAILAIALLMGSIVRIKIITGSSYPINDGGLFYQMVEDLLGSNLRLPEVTTYNNDQIPYAYPPLAFYIVAVLKMISSLPLLFLFRFVPLTTSMVTMLAYYLLARKILGNGMLTSLSVLFFALVPRSFEWFLMGGGITRGLGFLFAMLAIANIWDIFTENMRWFNILGAILFSAACILTHPETALFVGFIAGAFFVFHGMGWKNFLRGFMVGVGVLAIISPWIVRIISYHGLEPFLGAGGTGHKDWLEIKNFMTLNFGFENSYFLSVYAVFSLVAIFIRRDKLTYYLGGIIIAGYLFFPRSGPNLLTIIISPLAAMGIYELIALSGLEGDRQKGFLVNLENGTKPKLILAFIIVYLFFGAFTYGFLEGRDQLTLNEELISVYDWLETNAGEDDGIMFYPPAGQKRFWWNDFAAEWFPALTDKANLTTVQGSEWIEGEYQKRVDDYLALMNCADIGPVCIASWEADNDLQVDLLVIGQAKDRRGFIEHFVQDGSYQVVYSGSEYLVFNKESISD